MTGMRPPLTDQINDLALDLRAMHELTQDGIPLARGAALAVAHAALVLAVTHTGDEDLQMIRQEALDDALPVFVRAGLGHLVPLIQAALAVDVVAGRLARGVERPQ